MSAKPVILGAVSIAAVAALAGCGGSSGTTTPTPSGISIPGIPGLTTPGSGSTGSSGGAGANTILSVSDVASISGDPNVTVVTGTCSATTCVYADTSSSDGGGGGIIVVEPIPGGLSQVALQAALAGALSSSGSSSSGGTVTPVSGLGSAALKDIDTDSATYAFSKDNYFVVISVTSSVNSGSAMDPQVNAAAQSAAGKL